MPVFTSKSSPGGIVPVGANHIGSGKPALTNAKGVKAMPSEPSGGLPDTTGAVFGIQLAKITTMLFGITKPVLGLDGLIMLTPGEVLDQWLKVYPFRSPAFNWILASR